MSGHKNFDELRKQIDADPERRRRVEKQKRELDRFLELHEWMLQQGYSEEEAKRVIDPFLSFGMSVDDDDLYRVCKLVNDWMNDKSGYDEETWPELREYLQRIGKM